MMAGPLSQRLKELFISRMVLKKLSLPKNPMVLLKQSSKSIILMDVQKKPETRRARYGRNCLDGNKT